MIRNRSQSFSTLVNLWQTCNYEVFLGRWLVLLKLLTDKNLTLFNLSVLRELFQITFSVNVKWKYSVHFWVPLFHRRTRHVPAMVHQIMFPENSGIGGGMPTETKFCFFRRLDASNHGKLTTLLWSSTISVLVKVAGQSPKSTWNFDPAQPVVVPLLNYFLRAAQFRNFDSGVLSWGVWPLFFQSRTC